MTATVTSAHVFLSYHTPARAAVDRIREKLSANGISTFLDHDNLALGLPWPSALEKAMDRAAGVLVFVGRELGGWQKREMWFALDRQIQEERAGRAFPVIPVLLPGADAASGFLSLNTWVDLRGAGDHVTELDALVSAFAGDERREYQRLPLNLQPYAGLAAFREEQKAFFFGRDAFTKRLVEKALSGPLAAVVGPSGSGKSSVVRAGLIPSLRMRRPPEPSWDVAVFVPRSDPFHSMARCLIPLLEPERTDTERLVAAQRLADHLLKGDIRLAPVIESVLEKSQGTERLLLVLDQFEELFTTARSDLVGRFLEVLLTAIDEGRHTDGSGLTVALTLRADFYARALEANRRLSDRLEAGQINLGPMTREELEDAIAQPARRVGVDVDASLRQTMIDRVIAQPGGLPLLQYALEQMWSRRDGTRITHATYDAVGGIEKAIAQRADEEFMRLKPPEQDAARRVMTSLVRIGTSDSPVDTRRQLRLDQSGFGAAEMAVIQRFAAPDVRLLVAGTDGVQPTGQMAKGAEIIQVAHEALITNWGRLRDWLDADREFYLWRQRLRTLAEEWQRSGEDDGALLRGGLLAEAERWSADRTRELSDPEGRLIQQSIEARARAAREADQAHRRLENQVARFLITAAARDRPEFPCRSLLLAIEAVRRANTPETESGLREILADAGGLPLSGHLGGVHALAISPDGYLVASGSDDFTVRLWSLNDATRDPRVLRGHENYVTSVAFSRDGRLLASGSHDGTVRIWRPYEPGQAPFVIRTDERTVDGVVFSADGETLASFGPRLKLWSLARPGDPSRILDVEATSAPQADSVVRSGFVDAAFSADGRWLVSVHSGEKSGVWLWSLKRSTVPVQFVTGWVAGLWRVGFSEDSELLAVVGGGNARVWRVAALAEWLSSGEALSGVARVADLLRKVPEGFRGELGESSALDVSVRGDGQLAIAMADGTIQLWKYDGENVGVPDTRPRSHLVLRGHEGPVWSVAFAPDKGGLVSSGQDGTLRLWPENRAECEPIRFKSDRDPTGVAFTADGRQVAVIGEDRLTLHSIDGSTEPRILKEFARRNTDRALAVSREGRWLACGAEGSIYLWPLGQLDTEPTVLAADLAGVTGLAFSADNAWMASGSKDGRIRLWRVSQGAGAPTILTAGSPVAAVAFDPSERWIAAATNDGLLLWPWSHLDSAPLILEAATDAVSDVAFSGDGQWLACASMDGGVRLWRPEHLDRCVRVLSAHSIGPKIAFSSDSAWLAKGSAGEGVQLWSLADAERPPRAFKYEELWGIAVAFSPDGRWLAGAGSHSSATCVLWTLDVDEVMKKARAIAGRNLTPQEWSEYFGDEPYRKT